MSGTGSTAASAKRGFIAPRLCVANRLAINQGAFQLPGKGYKSSRNAFERFLPRYSSLRDLSRDRGSYERCGLCKPDICLLVCITSQVIAPLETGKSLRMIMTDSKSLLVGFLADTGWHQSYDCPKYFDSSTMHSWRQYREPCLFTWNSYWTSCAFCLAAR